MKFRFTAEMFSRAELQRKFGDDAPWFYERIASIANALLEAEEAKCQRVYSMKRASGNFFGWTNERTSEDDHTALLWNVEKIEGEK